MKCIYSKLFKAIFPQVSSVILAILTGVLGSEISSHHTWKSSGLFKFTLVVSVIIVVVNIILSFCYYKRDKDLKEMQSQIDKQVNIINKCKNKYNSLLNACGDLGAEFAKSSEKIYKTVKSAEMTGQMRLDNWNKKDLYDFICSSLHEYICNIAEKLDDFSVSIITRNYHDNETFYFMISRSFKSKGKPKIYQTEISENIAKKYFYGKIFLKNNPEPVVLNKKEIKNNFYFSTISKNNQNKYSQYIGIPICCSGNNMIALLQIIAHRNGIISRNPEELDRLISTIIFAYSNLILLGDKIEKSLLVYNKSD